MNGDDTCLVSGLRKVPPAEGTSCESASPAPSESEENGQVVLQLQTQLKKETEIQPNMSVLKVFNHMRRMVRASPCQTEKDTCNWPRRLRWMYRRIHTLKPFRTLFICISHLVLVIDLEGDIKSACSHRW